MNARERVSLLSEKLSIARSNPSGDRRAHKKEGDERKWVLVDATHHIATSTPTLRGGGVGFLGNGVEFFRRRGLRYILPLSPCK